MHFQYRSAQFVGLVGASSIGPERMERMRYEKRWSQCAVAASCLLTVVLVSSSAGAAKLTPVNELRGTWNEPLHFILKGHLQINEGGQEVTADFTTVYAGATLVVTGIANGVALANFTMGSAVVSGVLHLPASATDPATDVPLPATHVGGGVSAVRIDVSGSLFTITGTPNTTFRGSYTSSLLAVDMTTKIAEDGVVLTSTGRISFTKTS